MSGKLTSKKEYLLDCIIAKNRLALYYYIPPMNLMMYIGNDLIESIPLELERISSPGYVGNFKRKLKIKYNELIQQYPDKPEFLVINPVPHSYQVINKTNPNQ